MFRIPSGSVLGPFSSLVCSVTPGWLFLAQISHWSSRPRNLVANLTIPLGCLKVISSLICEWENYLLCSQKHRSWSWYFSLSQSCLLLQSNPSAKADWFYFLIAHLKKIFFWPHCMPCGILVPQPGIIPAPVHWKHRVLTTGMPGKSLQGPLICLLLFIATIPTLAQVCTLCPL